LVSVYFLAVFIDINFIEYILKIRDKNPIIPDCVSSFISSGDTMPLFGPPDVQKLKAKRDIKGLRNAMDYGLKHQDMNYTLEVAFALAEIKAYSPALAIGIINKDWKVRQKTYSFYSQFSVTGFIPLLVALHDKEEMVRLSSMMAFLLRGEKRATKPIADCLIHDPSVNVRRGAVPTLLKLAGADALESFFAARNDSDAEVRKAVNEALATLGF
jgi:hypothetical protein